MNVKILKILQESANRTDALLQLDALLKKERAETMDRAIAQLDRRDPGYNRVLKRLLEIKSEK